MELFAKITTFYKSFISDVWQSLEYVSVIPFFDPKIWIKTLAVYAIVVLIWFVWSIKRAIYYYLLHRVWSADGLGLFQFWEKLNQIKQIKNLKYQNHLRREIKLWSKNGIKKMFETMKIIDCFWKKKQIGMIFFKNRNTKKINGMRKIADNSVNLSQNCALQEMFHFSF